MENLGRFSAEISMVNSRRRRSEASFGDRSRRKAIETGADQNRDVGIRWQRPTVICAAAGPGITKTEVNGWLLGSIKRTARDNFAGNF
jgi:hypothetical protein